MKYNIGDIIKTKKFDEQGRQSISGKIAIIICLYESPRMYSTIISGQEGKRVIILEEEIESKIE